LNGKEEDKINRNRENKKGKQNKSDGKEPAKEFDWVRKDVNENIVVDDEDLVVDNAAKEIENSQKGIVGIENIEEDEPLNHEVTDENRAVHVEPQDDAESQSSSQTSEFVDATQAMEVTAEASPQTTPLDTPQRIQKT
jgi:hypothetical protein